PGGARWGGWRPPRPGRAGRAGPAGSPRRDSGPRPPPTPTPQDQAALGTAAGDRGLYRDAAQLHKNAAAAGIIGSAGYLARPPDCLQGDPRPALWAAAHADLGAPYLVASLLDRLLWAGAPEQAAPLPSPHPPAHAQLP